jgi:hypothetical protein
VAELDYPPDKCELIVVDNRSADDNSKMDVRIAIQI